jgi:hypothetical protein
MNYTKTVYQTITRQVPCELTAGANWGCYTTRTNTSLRKKAETVIKKLEKAETRQQVRKAVIAFYKGWLRMCDSSTHLDAGVSDTEVRECVRGFGEDAIDAYGKFFDPIQTEEDIYDMVQSLPASELRHRSNK